MKLNHTFLNIISENSPKSTIRSRLEHAIKNRIPVSFYYKGPPGEVLPGRRLKVELVASGLTKKGNLAVRGFVQPPSTSKKGFNEHGWRTFLVNRISSGSLTIYDDEQFNNKRPKYKEGEDSSFSVTYVTSDWGVQKQPKIEKPDLPQPKEKEIEKPDLPQPKEKEKPSPIPTVKREIEVYDDLKTKIKIINNQKQISPDDLKQSIDTLYQKKVDDWESSQREKGGNLSPGEGTRRKFERESEIDLFRLLKQDNVQVINSDENNELQEEIKRVKTLIFF
jgi:hypothetical protein